MCARPMRSPRCRLLVSLLIRFQLPPDRELLNATPLVSLDNLVTSIRQTSESSMVRACRKCQPNDRGRNGGEFYVSRSQRTMESTDLLRQRSSHRSDRLDRRSSLATNGTRVKKGNDAREIRRRRPQAPRSSRTQPLRASRRGIRRLLRDNRRGGARVGGG